MVGVSKDEFFATGLGRTGSAGVVVDEDPFWEAGGDPSRTSSSEVGGRPVIGGPWLLEGDEDDKLNPSRPMA